MLSEEEYNQALEELLEINFENEIINLGSAFIKAARLDLFVGDSSLLLSKS